MATISKNPSTSMIASTLIIAILFIGAIYFWSRQADAIRARQLENSTAALKNTESDLSDLESELKAVNFDQVETDSGSSTQN